jgi:hypothetical protein
MSGVETDETRDLISSDKVEGTSVYDRNGNNLGTISNVMLDKRSGQVAYAVLSFGGFLGMGSRYHPLPDQFSASALVTGPPEPPSCRDCFALPGGTLFDTGQEEIGPYDLCKGRKI